MILISTGTVDNQTACQTAKQYASEGINSVELSGGRFSSSLLKDLNELKKDISLFIHNYFPPADIPFVFNLASLDQEIASLSIQHAYTAIQLSVDLGNPIYSFHAGYLINLQPEEIGKAVNKRQIYKRKESLSKFIEQVNKLSIFAQKEGVELLIENNILLENNYKEFGCDLFLMTTPDESLFVMQNTPENVNLLIDLGHLKVSAQTLGYNPIEMLTKCEQWIQAYHLNENDGISDNHEPVKIDSWFWPYLKRKQRFYSLEIRNVSSQILLEQYRLVEKILAQSSQTLINPQYMTKN